MECPSCKLISPDTALRCDCGYNFETRSLGAVSRSAQPLGTRSVNGVGTQLFGYAPAGNGVYEATIWFTFLYVPLFPKSAWLVRPQWEKSSSLQTTQSVEFLERRKISAPSVLKVYAGALFAVGPFVVAEGMIAMSTSRVGTLQLLLPLAWVVLWAGVGRIRRDRVFKRTR